MKNGTIHSNVEIPMGDSKEALQEYYKGRICQLEKALDRLNLLDHPVEIESICAKIIEVKRMLHPRRVGKFR
jgi:hypothetical protein